MYRFSGHDCVSTRNVSAGQLRKYFIVPIETLLTDVSGCSIFQITEGDLMTYEELAEEVRKILEQIRILLQQEAIQ